MGSYFLGTMTQRYWDYDDLRRARRVMEAVGVTLFHPEATD
jgi:hypothetical protein